MKTLKCLFVGLLVLSFAAFIAPMQGSAEGIECPPPEITVTKTAHAFYTRRYDWCIDKRAELDGVPITEPLILSVGQELEVEYKVEVTATPHDIPTVIGDICVTNNTDHVLRIYNVVDEIEGIGPIFVPVIAFYLEPHETRCIPYRYEDEVLDDCPRLNTVTVYLCEEPFVAEAMIDFCGAAVEEKIDECVDIADELLEIAEHYCAPHDGGTEIFSRLYMIGPYRECGEYSICNVATLTIPGCEPVVLRDELTIYIEVPCDHGCTLTPGYWKNHSTCGNASTRDNAWNSIGPGEPPNHEDTPFFSSGKTWCEALWTPPKRGDAYYILAHAYIPAVLNIINGASHPLEVDEALEFAEHFFQTHDPGTKDKDAKNAAAILDDYNNGYIGPGHCDENEVR